MAIDDDATRRPAVVPTHVVGEKLDDLSLRDFEERIGVLRLEIERLEQAKHVKQDALSLAGSLFRAGPGI